MKGGIVLSARVGDDLVEDRPGKVLVPGDGARLRHDLDAGGAVSLGFEGDAHVAVADRALDVPLLDALPLFALRFRLVDLELVERLARGRCGPVDRRRHDRLDTALGHVDRAARTRPGRGQETAGDQQGHPPPRGAAGQHALPPCHREPCLRSNQPPVCNGAAWGEYPRPAEPRATAFGPWECYPDHRTEGRKRQSVGAWETNRWAGGACGTRSSARKTKGCCAKAHGIRS